MIKKLILTISLLITISMYLMSCGQNKLEKYFDITVSPDTLQTDFYGALIGNNVKMYGIAISAKKGLDLKVNGKVVFKKIKLSYYDKYKTQRFVSNESEFEIKLNDVGTNRSSAVETSSGREILTGNAMEICNIENKDGNKVFPNFHNDICLNNYEVEIVEYDAYFEGTVEER